MDFLVCGQLWNKVQRKKSFPVFLAYFSNPSTSTDHLCVTHTQFIIYRIIIKNLKYFHSIVTPLDFLFQQMYISELNWP